MAVEFKIVRGARAGAQERFEKSVISIGRHPMNDLRFDPNKDPDCSSRHAELRAVGGHYFLRDIGSTNGTFVNGERIVGEKELIDGDTVSFGFDGPQVTVHTTEGSSAASSAAAAPSTRVGTPDQPQRVVQVAVPLPLVVPVASGYLEPIEPPTAAGPLIPVKQREPDPLPPSRHPPPPPLEPPPPVTPLSLTPAGELRRPAAPILPPENRGQLAATMHGAPYRPPPGMTMGGGAPPRRNTEVRIAEAVKKQTGHLSKMVIALTLLVVVGGSVGGWFALQASKSQKEQFATLMAANDSLARALEQRLTQTGVAAAALREARSESERLARELRATQERGGDISAISTEMRNQQVRTSTISRMDFSAVTAANKAAIVFIVVEMTDGKLTSGTGFNILPSGLVVTNKHVVRTADGTPAARVAVAFDGQRGSWKEATIEYVSETDEIALLRFVRPGNFPTVAGIAREAREVRIGDPVAILGYPLGTSTAGMTGNIDELRPEATLGVGTVSKMLTDVLQLDAFAAQGSSGSPVFDSRGLVVGVLYGAAAESGGRIIYCVPSARLAAQLPSDAAAVLR